MKDMELFNRQGCLSTEGIMRYANKELSHDELLKADQHLMQCDLCRTAIEGIQSLPDKRSFSDNVGNLKKIWAGKHSVSNITSRKIFYVYGPVAASIVILAGIFFLTSNHSPFLQRNIAYVPPKMISIDSVNFFYGNIVPIETKTQTPPKKDKKAREKYIHAHVTAERENMVSASVKNARIVAHRVDTTNSIEIGEIENLNMYNTPTHSTLMSLPPVYDDNDDALNGDERNQNVVTICEKMPHFEDGGIKEFSRYVHKEIRYPRAALEAGIQGRVYVQFTIDETGKLIDPKILKGCNVLLEKEVLRVLHNSPHWEPGMQSGSSVKVSMTMPVEFHIRN